MQGRVPEEIFEAGALQAKPVRVAAPAALAAAATEFSGAVMSPEDEQVVMERLRDLGYIE